MRDLKPTDQIKISANGSMMIVTEHGVEFLCWNGLQDLARWWLRQSELLGFDIPEEHRLVFKAVLGS